MYISKPFVVNDKKTLFNLIEDYSFGILFSTHDGSPNASHLPFVLDRENEMLYGHFARQNNQWMDVEDQEILTVFQGPHHYISSSWYETSQSVPTWNYAAVHVYGSIEWIDDEQELLKILNEMVFTYEDSSSSYHLDEGNKNLIDGLMKGIVGFKIKINRMEGNWKLSQNHSRERQERVIEKLQQNKSDNAQDIAKLMKENLNKL